MSAPPPAYSSPYPQPQQQQPYPPPPQQQPYPQGQHMQQPYPQPQGQQPGVVVVQQPQQTVVVTGGCPSCGRGALVEEYTCCGIVLAICFFPLGIICCLMMKERKCTSCGAIH